MEDYLSDLDLSNDDYLETKEVLDDTSKELEDLMIEQNWAYKQKKKYRQAHIDLIHQP